MGVAQNPGLLSFWHFDLATPRALQPFKRTDPCQPCQFPAFPGVTTANLAGPCLHLLGGPGSVATSPSETQLRDPDALYTRTLQLVKVGVLLLWC